MPRVWGAGLLVLIAGGLSSLFWVDESRPTDPEPAVPPSPFVFEAPARAVLQSLWRESLEAKEERVACLSGHGTRAAFHINRVERVPHERADSTHVSPGPSLDLCRPPQWVGTVHTHIVAVGGRAYGRLSPADHAVTRLWRAKWRADGVFCVLYSETRAYCEYGSDVSGDAPYSSDQGGAIPP